MSFPIATSLSSKIKLNDGVEMPLFGLGVYRAEPGNETEMSVTCALNHGYQLIDTAARYRNEEDVGKALQKSNIKRENIFVVTKLWNDDHGYDKTIKAFNASLQRLSLTYIDLYLIHFPHGSKLLETYQAILDLKKMGLIRSVGVSNFEIPHLKGLSYAGLPLPSVNQIELHPFLQRPELVKYCQDIGVAVMGYSPLVRGQKFNDPRLIELAKKYCKSASEILIRWSVQKHFITIPKSSQPKHILQNSKAFHWNISDHDMALMESWPEHALSLGITGSPGDELFHFSKHFDVTSSESEVVK